MFSTRVLFFNYHLLIESLPSFNRILLYYYLLLFIVIIVVRSSCYYCASRRSRWECFMITIYCHELYFVVSILILLLLLLFVVLVMSESMKSKIMGYFFELSESTFWMRTIIMIKIIVMIMMIIVVYWLSFIVVYIFLFVRTDIIDECD